MTSLHMRADEGALQRGGSSVATAPGRQLDVADTVTAPPPRERPFARLGLASVRQYAYLLPAVALIPLIAFPLFFLIYGTFRSKPPGQDGTWTLDNYAALFSGSFVDLVRTTVVIAIFGTAVSFVLALLLSISIARLRVPGAKWLDSWIVAPAYLPGFIGAIAWSYLLSPRIGWVYLGMEKLHLPILPINSLWGIIFVTGIYGASVAYLFMRPAFLAVDNSSEEAAQVLGAGRRRVMARIVLPLVMPSLMAAATILFVKMLGEFAVVSVLGTRSRINVIATQVIYQTTVASPAQPGQAAVLGLGLACTTLIGLSLAAWAMRGKGFVTVGGRGSTERPPAPPLQRLAGLVFCLAFIFVVLILPIVVMVVGSLQPYLSPTLSSGWTLDNFWAVWNTPNAMRAIVNTIQLSVMAAVLAVALSVALGYGVVRRPSRITAAIDGLAALPLAIPHVVFGLAMVWAWVGIQNGIYGTRWILLVAYVALFLPYVMRSTNAGLSQIDKSLEEAARLGGAGTLRVAWRVILPLLTPALLSGATIVLYHSTSEITSSLMLYSPGSEVLPVEIYSAHSNGAFGKLYALCVINVGLIVLMVAVGNRLASSQRRL